MADAFYKSFMQQVVDTAHDWEYYDCYIMLLTDVYDPAGVDTHVYVSDVTAWEASGTGYNQGGQVLVDGLTGWLKDAGQQTVSLTIPADPEWAASSITARYAVLYTNATDAPPVDSSSILVALLDLGQNVTSIGSAFTVEFDPSGLVLKVNGAAQDTGYQYHVQRAFQAYPHPYNNSTKVIDLLSNAYDPDYENHNDDADTAAFIVQSFTPVVSNGVEGDDYIFRQEGDQYTFLAFTGTFRYVCMRRSSGGDLGTCIDLGQDITANAENLVLNFADGFMRFNITSEVTP